MSNYELLSINLWNNHEESMTVKTGNKAPNFTLYNTDKEEVTLSEFQNDKNVVLLFFPLAFTGVCTKELCGVRDEIQLYNDLNAEVLGISVDSIFTLGKFKEEQGYNFTMLSDYNKEASRAYGALYEDFVLGMKGVAKRSAFVIDKSGTIRYAEVLESAGDLPDFDKIKSTLGGLN